MVEIRASKIDGYHAVISHESGDVVGYLDDYPSRPRPPADDNEMSYPPAPVAECRGEDCNLQQLGQQCLMTRHHLLSTAGQFEMLGSEAEDFRNLLVLTVWMPECRHAARHNQFQLNTGVPNLEVMRKAVSEASKLRDINNNYRYMRALEIESTRSKTHWRDAIGLRRDVHELAIDRKDLLKEIPSIEVIPAALVTGALLIPAPGHARHRIIFENTGFALTGTMERDEIEGAAQFGYAATACRALYQESLRRASSENLAFDSEEDLAAVAA